ncbi:MULTISPECIES: cupin domain-containing protein [Rhodococcus]|uniref:cupin domain-containing protein n=1 Tax=Rhodococcus TaxID=1827 RepID=UPI001C5A13FA|nr:cupin domain-containing protein [Rhodococcus sp. LW-XY12]QXU55587.1 cupin domain-containing protein [Rhodococcus sp. LW-XY12]
MGKAFACLTRIDNQSATREYGTQCQRIFPGVVAEDTFGAMACWLESNSSTALDEHNQRELIIVLRGDGSLTSGDDVQTVATGDVVMIERGHPHVIHSGGDELHWISLFWPRIEPVRQLESE